MMADLSLMLAVLLLLAQIATLVRIMLRPQRDPASRVAWVVTTLAVPLLGIIAYLLLGELRISERRRRLQSQIEHDLPHSDADEVVRQHLSATAHAAPFALAETVNALPPTRGNGARLAADSNSAIAEMVADIDAAQSSVHLCFYIWLADGNGLKIKAALIRAAQRGVQVRVLADALGSRHFIRSAHWHALQAAGVDARAALPIGGLIWTFIRGRFDLRNHRKQLIIDNHIAWCGSQNLADPQFLPKCKFGPWVDIMIRWQGPVVRDCQFIFIADWMGERGDDITALLSEPFDQPATAGDGIIAQVIGTGPSQPYPAMASCFTTLIASARRELVLTTPYFVPNDALIGALLDCARRGVHITMILPRRNDSRIVAATSRSYYEDLVGAGVELHEFEPGLLHAKTIVVDGCLALVGSANLDRRSFELNFENNILFTDRHFAAEILGRQSHYLAQSRRVTRDSLQGQSVLRRLWQNLLAMLSPLL